MDDNLSSKLENDFYDKLLNKFDNDIGLDKKINTINWVKSYANTVVISFFKKCAVIEILCFINSKGGHSHKTVPPRFPPSGPISMIWSATFITSMFCINWLTKEIPF